MKAKRDDSYYEHLKSKWTKKHRKLSDQLWSNHAESLNWLKSSKQFLVSSLAGMLLLAAPANTSILSQQSPPNTQIVKKVINKTHLMSELSSILPDTVQPLTVDQEQQVGKVLHEYFNMNVSAELNGIRLNRSYGLIGQEQHLTRYPGDTMDTHFQSADEYQFAPTGMAPGRGAYRYFASSRETMTQKDIAREKYYIAVPTFLAPGWNEHANEYYNFFKFRKMLVVNPENGKAVVCDIGDSGPAEWTGKHLGGSPEVMTFLERHDGAARGPVLYYFIDDPNDTIPLGPVSME